MGSQAVSVGKGRDWGPQLLSPRWALWGALHSSTLHCRCSVFPSWKAPPHLQDSYSSSEARFKHSPFFFEAWLRSATQDD